MLQFAVGTEQAAAIGADSVRAAAAHQAEFDGKPEESRHTAHQARELAHALGMVLDSGGHLGGSHGTLPEAHQDIGKRLLRVHRNMAGNVVEDVGFGEVVHATFRADGDGGGEFAASEAVEKEKSRDVAAYG